jgi:hypothetical protein
LYTRRGRSTICEKIDRLNPEKNQNEEYNVLTTTAAKIFSR